MSSLSLSISLLLSLSPSLSLHPSLPSTLGLLLYLYLCLTLTHSLSLSLSLSHSHAYNTQVSYNKRWMVRQLICKVSVPLFPHFSVFNVDFSLFTSFLFFSLSLSVDPVVPAAVAATNFPLLLPPQRRLYELVHSPPSGLFFQPSSPPWAMLLLFWD